MDQPVSKLQVHNLVLIEFAHSNVKTFPHLKLTRTFHICKWISFAISTFVIIEEMAPACPCIAAPQAD